MDRSFFLRVGWHTLNTPFHAERQCQEASTFCFDSTLKTILFFAAKRGQRIWFLWLMPCLQVQSKSLRICGSFPCLAVCFSLLVVLLFALFSVCRLASSLGIGSLKQLFQNCVPLNDHKSMSIDHLRAFFVDR
jgi:hypothetical protein